MKPVSEPSPASTGPREHQVDSGLSGTSVNTQGRYQGMPAKLVSNPRSLVDSAAEEMTFALAEKQGDSHARRKKRADDRGDLREALGIQHELIREVELQRQLSDSADKLKKQGLQTVRQLQAFLNQYDPDPYQQYRLLQHTRESLGEAPGDHPVRALIDSASQELETSAGEQIRGGVNIQGVAEAFAAQSPGMDDRKWQGVYQTAILDYGGLAQTWQKLLDQHSAGGVEQGVRFLMKSLAADYRAHGSSIDKTQLSMIMQDMQKLRLLNTLYERCNEVLERRGLPGYSGRRFMSDVLAIQDSQWLEDSAIRAFTLLAGEAGSESVIGFLRELKGVFTLLPAEMLGGEEHREQIVDRIQAFQDNHIHAEERRRG